MHASKCWLQDRNHKALNHMSFLKKNVNTTVKNNQIPKK